VPFFNVNIPLTLTLSGAYPLIEGDFRRLQALFIAARKRRKAAHSKGFARFVAPKVAKRLECGASHRFQAVLMRPRVLKVQWGGDIDSMFQAVGCVFHVFFGPMPEPGPFDGQQRAHNLCRGAEDH